MKNVRAKNKYLGFSLVEMIIAIFVFSVIMTTVTATFVSVINTRKKVKAVQQDVEDARFAMELMAKTLRTSHVVSPTLPSTVSDIKVFDYSQSKCIEYRLAGNKLQSGEATAVDEVACATATPGPFSDMTSGYLNNLSLDVIPSSGTTRGKVTIAMKICYNLTCSGANSDAVNIQTTVSLRDYEEVNP